MAYAASPWPSVPPWLSVPPSQVSSSTNTQANSTKLLANSEPIPGTELRLNFGSSGVASVEDSCNSKEALPGISILILVTLCLILIAYYMFSFHLCQTNTGILFCEMWVWPHSLFQNFLFCGVCLVFRALLHKPPHPQHARANQKCSFTTSFSKLVTEMLCCKFMLCHVVIGLHTRNFHPHRCSRPILHSLKTISLLLLYYNLCLYIYFGWKM